MSGRSELVVALDVDTLDEAKKRVSQLGAEVGHYKIGHQLMTSEGPVAIRYLKEQNKTVFLDLKLHEISNSVAAAVRSAGRLGVDLVLIWCRCMHRADVK
ncbi:MAG: orotidine 5'-phosphate decarboxylase / HUMPS family protein [Endozoicomonas sp.]|uniref:orotidine 5'-phosphate decarboxylase / HUMPS family protein n=1 Tax=Endozoicomonas sp. TaxID=1892382 RepID=UPI003D9BEEB5